MADVDVSVNAVVKVCSASVQLQDVARRFSHGSGNQGLKQEYIQKYTQMQELVGSSEPPLESNQAVVKEGDSTTLIDFTNKVSTSVTEIKVADGKLVGIKCTDPDVAVIKSQTVTSPSGKFNIVVTDGVISDVTFEPVTPPEE